jgi:single-strand DNA-binding protein
MAQGENKVMLVGYAGSPAEVKSTQGGTLIANFQLATSEKYTDRNNNKVEKTEWHNIAAFARTAEIVRDYVAKGSLLYLEGKLGRQGIRKEDVQDPGRHPSHQLSLAAPGR